MLIAHTTNELQFAIAQLPQKLPLAFIPTMGALHEGHLSLVHQAINNNQNAVCSIFVNPTQFNDASDFKAYPKSIEQDIALLKKCGCQIVFIPNEQDVYGENYQQPYYDLGSIEKILEGQYRPGHFQGVCAVVDQLIKMVNPDLVYLGQKDLQQCVVIQKLLELKEWNKKITLVTAATIRSNEGLALSSRNKRLSKDGLRNAINLYKALSQSKQMLLSATSVIDFLPIQQTMKLFLTSNGFDKVDYFELIYNDFSIQKTFNPKTTNQTFIVAAAYIEGVRLIDNIQIV